MSNLKENKNTLKQAAQKILNLAIYQIGEEKTDSYREKLEDIDSNFGSHSQSRINFRTILPQLIQDKDKVIPILIHGIMSNSYNHFNSILRIVQESKSPNDLNAYFKYYKSKIDEDTVTDVFGSIRIIPVDWILSAGIAEVVHSINAFRDNNQALNDLCYVLETLKLNNEFIDC